MVKIVFVIYLGLSGLAIADDLDAYSKVLLRKVDKDQVIRCITNSDPDIRLQVVKGDLVYRILSRFNEAIKYEFYQVSENGSEEIFASCDNIGF